MNQLLVQLTLTLFQNFKGEVGGPILCCRSQLGCLALQRLLRRTAAFAWFSCSWLFLLCFLGCCAFSWGMKAKSKEGTGGGSISKGEGLFTAENTLDGFTLEYKLCGGNHWFSWRFRGAPQLRSFCSSIRSSVTTAEADSFSMLQSVKASCKAQLHTVKRDAEA